MKDLILVAFSVGLFGYLLGILVQPECYIDTTPVVKCQTCEEVSTKDIKYDGVARVTCYAPTGYRTASQKIPTYGMVASSDRTIPLGTKVFIEGYGYMTVEDRTALWVHKDHGFTLDIFMENGCDNKFGVKRLKYYVQKE